LTDNIMKSIGRQTGRHSNFTRQSLTAEQLLQLLSNLKGESLQDLRNAAAIKLMSLTGLRCIEVSRCNHGDLKGVSGKWYLQIQRKGEREKGSRILLPDEVVETLQRYLERKDNAEDFDAPLFSNAGPNSPGKRLSPRFLSRTVKKYLRAIGLNNRAYSAHSLRHTAACLASTSGAEIEEISAMLGHSTIGQTNTYLKSLGLRSGIEDRAINRVNDYWINFKKNAQKDIGQHP
jgi:site-specific recombinase XerD